jgi:hypothetical protein
MGRRKVLEEIGKNYYFLSVSEFPQVPNLAEKRKITTMQTLVTCMPIRREIFSAPPQTEHLAPQIDTASLRRGRTVSSVPSCKRNHKRGTDSGSGGISD